MQDLTASQSLTSPLMLFMHATMPFEHLHKPFIQWGQLISKVEKLRTVKDHLTDELNPN